MDSGYYEFVSAPLRLNLRRLRRASWPLSFFFACVVSLTAGAQQPLQSLRSLDLASLQQRAGSGDAAAESELGLRYWSGVGVAKDQAQALVWFHKAGEQGDRTAEVYLASAYNHGTGVCQDFTQAAFWLRRAAEQGDAESQWVLGNAYEFGRGVPMDSGQAHTWIQKAADQNWTVAQWRIARLESLAQGSDAPQIARAMDTPSVQQSGTCAQGALAEQNSAEMGDPQAQTNVGLGYEGNYDLAMKWLTRAAAYGSLAAPTYMLQFTVANYTPGKNDGVNQIASELGARSNRLSTAQTDYKAIAPADILGLLVNAESVKVDGNGISIPSSPAGDKRDGELWKACNGNKLKDGYSEPGEEACYRVVKLYRLQPLGGSAHQAELQLLMAALVRGCGLYALDPAKAYRGETCGLLGLALYKIGNVEAARAVWELAPGCFSYDEKGGSPLNGCTEAMADGDYFFGDTPSTQSMLMSADLNNVVSPARTAFRFEPQRLVKILWQSCSTVHDRPSCTLLKNYGANVDMSAVAEAESERHEAVQEYRQEKAAEFEQAQAASAARRNALLGALQSLPGGSDPNAIVNAGNQQGAAIRSIGDANAAQRQAVAAQEQAAAQQRAVLLAQQQANQASSTSAGNNNSYSSSGVGSTGSSDGFISPIAGDCVSEFWDPKYYNWLSFQNSCGQAIYLTWIAKNPSDTFGASGANLAVGQSTNSGWNQSEVTQKQNFALFICPTGYFPVDLNTGQQVRDPNAHYQCKKQ